MNLTMAATHVASFQTGIVSSGTDAAADFKRLFLTVAGALAAWVFLKWVPKITGMASLGLTIVMGVLLFWGIGIADSGVADKMLNDTISQYNNGSSSDAGEMPQRPKG